MQVGDIREYGIINVLECVLLKLEVNASLEEYHLLLVKVLQDVEELTKGMR